MDGRTFLPFLVTYIDCSLWGEVEATRKNRITGSGTRAQQKRDEMAETAEVRPKERT